ncbi:hypothetical protein LGL08_02090 [Clostridium estertheticum]|nr:hypothetical protein [Clostridium estertheticum]MCB2305287.1 hypothetical protein [Clostridium estertheticum]MCB2343443.1 hypothetical protein [Clostridium estertheticum]MCB2348363.1 hypothetical protein [Clostridium estertheticum]WAG47312.1 hypothetical protein LL127_07630 [Clostridium estertheticum]
MVEQMLIQLAQMKYMTSCSGGCNCGNGSKKASCINSSTLERKKTS